jgi:hypothetical protein
VDPLGGVVPAAIVQHTALAELADRFALVLPDIETLMGDVKSAQLAAVRPIP